MGYVEAIRVTPDQLTNCDSCQQDGLTTSGKYVSDSYGVPVLWFCFNCVNVNKVLN
jgi:hypothetical protein